jgi:hypothetical protein
LSFTTVVVTISGHFFSYDKSMPMPGTLARAYRPSPLKFFNCLQKIRAVVIGSLMIDQ